MILVAESLLFAASLILYLHCRFARPGSPGFGVSAHEWETKTQPPLGVCREVERA